MMPSAIRSKVYRRCVQLLAVARNRLGRKGRVYYVAESTGWIIENIGMSLRAYLGADRFCVTPTPYGIRKSIVHFGCCIVSNRYFWPDLVSRVVHPSNRVILTLYHFNEVPDESLRPLLAGIDQRVVLWHTSCEKTKGMMMQISIPEEKIVIIPIGFDAHKYRPASGAEKANLRAAWGIPTNHVLIGSFQMDDLGMTGSEPRLGKGPDIFCDAVEQIARVKQVFVLLTGPKREYVKNRLVKAGIPFRHDYLRDPNELVRYYQMLDLYLVTSRFEGGPRALLESQACGIPVISTRVGMAEDVLTDGINGFLVNVGDVGHMVEQALRVLDNEALRTRLVSQGLQTVKRYDYSILAGEYQRLLYSRVPMIQHPAGGEKKRHEPV